MFNKIVACLSAIKLPVALPVSSFFAEDKIMNVLNENIPLETRPDLLAKNLMEQLNFFEQEIHAMKFGSIVTYLNAQEFPTREMELIRRACLLMDSANPEFNEYVNHDTAQLWIMLIASTISHMKKNNVDDPQVFYKTILQSAELINSKKLYALKSIGIFWDKIVPYIPKVIEYALLHPSRTYYYSFSFVMSLDDKPVTSRPISIWYADDKINVAFSVIESVDVKIIKDNSQKLSASGIS